MTINFDKLFWRSVHRKVSQIRSTAHETLAVFLHHHVAGGKSFFFLNRNAVIIEKLTDCRKATDSDNWYERRRHIVRYIRYEQLYDRSL